MTPLAPVAFAECELHSQMRPAQPPWQQEKKKKRGGAAFQNVTLTPFLLCLSGLVFLPRLSHLSSRKRRLVSRRCLALLPGIKLPVCDREKEQQFAASFHTSYLITTLKSRCILFFFSLLVFCTKCPFSEKGCSVELSHHFLKVLLLVL